MGQSHQTRQSIHYDNLSNECGKVCCNSKCQSASHTVPYEYGAVNPFFLNECRNLVFPALEGWIFFRRYTGSLNETGEEYLRLRVVSAAEGTEPEGYTLLAEPIEFTLTADGQCLRDGAAFGSKTTDADGVCNIALTIYNRKGFTLPHTGADAPSLSERLKNE